jgi:hypothetical protein
MQHEAAQHRTDNDNVANDDEHETEPPKFAGRSQQEGAMRLLEMLSAISNKS